MSEENKEKLAKLEELDKKQTKREKEDFKVQLSVAERLMRRTQSPRFKTVFKDDLGEIVIETRLMTSSERTKALKLNQMLGQGQENILKYEEAVNGLKELAADICATPGLDEYLKSGDVSDDVIVSLVIRTLYGTLETVGESLTSFRPE